MDYFLSMLSKKGVSKRALNDFSNEIVEETDGAKRLCEAFNVPCHSG